MPKRSPGLPRDAVLSLRVPERVKFGLSLMTRLYHEPVPDIVIRAIQDAFTSENGGLLVDIPGEEHRKSLLSLVWADRESDRLANLAFRLPGLMTGAELRLWERIKGDPQFWSAPGSKPKTDGQPGRLEGELLRDVLAAEWVALREEQDQ